MFVCVCVVDLMCFVLLLQKGTGASSSSFEDNVGHRGDSNQTVSSTLSGNDNRRVRLKLTLHCCCLLYIVISVGLCH